MVLFCSAVLALGVGLLGLLLAWSSPGRPRPFLGHDGRPLAGSISEKVYERINGVDQGMIIKGRDQSKPVLLYLHGGLPDAFLEEPFPTGLEEMFTVCWWDQRGAGMSYSPDIPRETLTVEQLVSDTLELSKLLRRRFHQERIYLMGHSGGSFLGMHAIARAPELYQAYIGVAQMANQLDSEVSAYEYLLKRFKDEGDSRMVKRLEAAPVTRAGGVPRAYLMVRDEAMHRLGVGTMHDMRSIVTGIFLPSLMSRDYTLAEKLRLWRGKASTGVSPMWDEMLGTDLAARIPQVSVPVYFLHGVHDRTCSYSVAEAYFDRLKAPLKGFYGFARSAHSPIFEEPARVQEIVRDDVLGGTNRLADRR